MVVAKKWILKQNFVGEPKDEDLQLEEEELPELKDGDVLFEALYLSVDPYMRPYSKQMTTPLQMFGQQLATVSKSRNGKYPLGSNFLCNFGWRSHTVCNPDTMASGTPGVPQVMPAPDTQGLSVSLSLGTLGMTGATAYFGLLNICEPKAGETVLVSGAAGAVGMVVGQIAKVKGCKVIGYAGTDDKVKYLKELGFDHTYNYKTSDLGKTLKEAAPEGIDCYFDNVGGDFSNTVITQHMKMYGRIAVCGSISAYNAVEEPTGPELYGCMIGNRLKMQGFIVYQYIAQYPKAIQDLSTWVKEGKIKTRECVTEGIDNMREGFYGMLKGKNTGKAVIKA